MGQSPSETRTLSISFIAISDVAIRRNCTAEEIAWITCALFREMHLQRQNSLKAKNPRAAATHLDNYHVIHDLLDDLRGLGTARFHPDKDRGLIGWNVGRKTPEGLEQ